MADRILNAAVTSRDLLDCAVYGPSTSWGHRIRTEGPSEHSSVMWHGIKAYVFLENMECQLNPDSGREKHQMEQLVGALQDLKQPG